MTRQVALVFFGKHRASHPAGTSSTSSHSSLKAGDAVERVPTEPHESPRTMTMPLIILAACAIGLSVIGTPAWPWFQSFLGQHHGESGFTSDVISLMVLSSVVVFAGLGIGWWLYGRKPIQKTDEPDVLEKLPAGVHTWFAKKYGVDELYEMTVIRFNAWSAKACAFLDEWVWGGAVQLVSYLMLGFSWISRAFDEFVINLGFDQSCDGVARGGKIMSRLQDGRVQNYLRIIGLGLVALVLFLVWGGGE
jgi:NADH-quinone oxidoreductase subunit L